MFIGHVCVPMGAKTCWQIERVTESCKKRIDDRQSTNQYEQGLIDESKYSSKVDGHILAVSRWNENLKTGSDRAK